MTTFIAVIKYSDGLENSQIIRDISSLFYHRWHIQFSRVAVTQALCIFSYFFSPICTKGRSLKFWWIEMYYPQKAEVGL